MAVYDLSEKALDDLDRLYEYGVLTFGLMQADEYYDGLLARFQEITETPRLYPAVDHVSEGCRLSVFRAHSIYYRITDSGILIIRLLGREDAEKELKTVPHAIR